MSDEPVNLIELARKQADRHAQQVLYRCLPDEGDEAAEISFAELDRRARALAEALQQRLARGERVLVLAPVDLETIVAFFGCIYAGMIAVPVPPPRPMRPCSRIQGVLDDARPALVLAPSSLFARAAERFGTNVDLMTLPWLDVAAASVGTGAGWNDPVPAADDLAFLQYTSGSTAAPKGVMLSHGNLLANLKVIYEGFGNRPGITGVFWLPFYHDMGLIGGVLQTLYTGGTNTFFSPASFVQKPFRWLKTISETRAAIAGGPCFAFDLCVRKTTLEQRAQLDLSCWEMAFTGAEPVHAETLRQFAEAFAPCGFRREALYPCYGLAESTLMVSGGKKLTPTALLNVASEPLRLKKVEVVPEGAPGARTVVSCGRSFPGQTLAIVDPETSRRTDGIGEIWIAGPSVAQGYWNNEEATNASFRARIAGSTEGPFLRTGDLGFQHNGELCIVGRSKDVIIIRGRNYYPADIERSVEACHPLIRPGSTAAFSFERDDWEQLALAVEVDRPFREANADEVVVAVRQAVGEHHEVEVSTIVLLKPGALPRTSSGKIQRSKARETFAAGEFQPISTWQTANRPEELADAEETLVERHAEEDRPRPTREEVEAWLIERVASRMGISAKTIDVRAPLVTLGLSSKEAVVLSAQLEGWLRRPVAATLIFNYPTIDAIARFLSGEQAPAAAEAKSDLPDVTRLTDAELRDLIVQELARMRSVARAETALPAGLNTLQQAVLALTEARRQSEAFWQAQAEPIAIVGMGCRFPGGVDGPDKFWELLVNGVDAIRELPKERWDVDQFYDPEPGKSGKAYTRWGGFLEGVDRFEPEFFGVSPREATYIDPQQRVLLEVAWEALEDAGIAPSSLAGTNAGVYVGAIGVDWVYLLGKELDNINAHLGPGAAHSILANRISYLFDFHGPSIALDTACSASLVTVHLACKALRRRETDVALAGGVNLVLSPEMTIALSQARMMSPTGRCHTFDAAADGYVRGEGCGLVVLKRLSDAVAEGDRVIGIIRGTAVNQDGRSNGLIAPSGPAQEAVIRAALAEAHLRPQQIDYVEAHGTGTAIGDPIEVQALAAALTRDRSPADPLYVGSVKTNIGHLESAAGIAGLMKALLAVNKGVIPPHLHLQKRNPLLKIDDAPLDFPTKLTPWPERGEKRYAGVSSFGFGGTNAHLVLEAPSAPTDATNGQPDRPLHLLTLSARTPEALRELAKRYADRLKGDTTLKLADFAWTVNVGRTPLTHRAAIVAADSAEAAALLEGFANGQESPAVLVGEVVAKGIIPLAFLMTGQGAQYAGMGRGLYETQPVFRAALDRCDEWLRPHLERPLLSVLYPADGETSPIDETRYTQPALFALEYALLEMWKSWGIKPAAAMGHSVGEFAAAVAAGVLEPKDAARLVAERGRLMFALPAGGVMHAIFAPEEKVRQAIDAAGVNVSVAALNGPTNTVISGTEADAEKVVAAFTTEGVKSQRLVTSHAFHSALLDPMLDDLEKAARGLKASSPRIDLVSNLTGVPASADLLADAGYWRRHARSPVQFTRSIQYLADHGYSHFLEVGPNPTLLGMARRCLSNDAGQWLPSLRKNGDDWRSVLESLGALFIAGVAVDWAGFEKGYTRRKVAAPTYPFQRQSYWVGEMGVLPGLQKAKSARSEAGPALHPLLGYRIDSPIADRIFENRIGENTPPVIGDHRVHGGVIVPCATFIETALAAAHHAGDYVVTEFTLHQPLAIPGKGERTWQTIVTPGDSGQATFRIAGRGADGAWVTHASGRLLASADALLQNGKSFVPTQVIERIGGEPLGNAWHECVLQLADVHHGPSFRWVEQQWTSEGEVIARLRAGKPADDAESYRVHPGLLEACMLLMETTQPGFESAMGVHALTNVGEIRVHAPSHGGVWAHVTGRPEGEGNIVGDIHLYDDAGRHLLELHGVKLRRIPRDWLARQVAGSPPEWLHELAWAEASLASVPTRKLGRWLIVADRSGLGASLAKRLEAAGASCRVIDSSESAVRATVAEWAKKEANDGPAEGIVYAAALDLNRTDAVDVPQLIELSAGRLLDALHGLGDASPSRYPRLWMVTRGSTAVGENAGPIAVSQAPLWGLARVVAVEMPEVDCARIDLDPAGAESDVAALFAEFSANGREAQVAYRGETRFAARLRRVTLTDIAPVVVRRDRTYLITGGLSGLGLLTARWLVNRGARSLALTGRRGATGESAEVIRILEADGAKVHVLKADVGRREDLEEVLRRIDAGMPPLGGVFHAAGILDDGVLRQQSRERFANVMAAKVQGAWNLHELTKDRPLELFVLFSSAASLLGSPGQGNYAAANAFLDGLAHLRAAAGLPALSVNWGGWAEVGMAAELDRREGRRHDAGGVGRIDPVHGLLSLEQLLGQSRPQVGVLPIDWAEFFEQFPAGLEPTWLAEMGGFRKAGGDSGPPELVKKLEEVPAADKPAVVLAWVQGKAAHVLRVAAGTLPDPRRSLNELGVDSLMGVELCNALGRGVGRHLAPTILFAHPTLGDLAEHLTRDVLGIASVVAEQATPTVDEATERALAEVEGLTEEQIEAMILGELSNKL